METQTRSPHAASCLCRAIRFEVTGELPPLDACHCTQCRKFSGHFGAGTDVKRTQLQMISGEDLIGWYRTENVRRGFCKTCGSSLFFDPDGHDWIGISMGAFDTPTHTRIREHIFLKYAGDYYEVTDDLPKFETYPGAPEGV